MNCFGVTSGTYFLSAEIKLQRDYIVCYILCKKDKLEINENNYLQLVGRNSGKDRDGDETSL